MPAIIAIGRFLVLYLAGDGGGHVQSLVLSAALLAMATVFLAVGVLADLVAANRNLLEDIRARELLRATRPNADVTKLDAPRKRRGIANVS